MIGLLVAGGRSSTTMMTTTMMIVLFSTDPQLALARAGSLARGWARAGLGGLVLWLSVAA